MTSPNPLLCLAAACLLTACAHAPPSGTTGRASPGVWLLGEVHDNPAGHEARARLLRERVESGWRPAIAMEQFDTDQQGALSAAMSTCTDADCVVEQVAPGTSGWNWDLYKPVITLALEFDLPLVAANLSRGEASKVVKGGFEASLPPELIARYRLDTLPKPLLEAQVVEVRDGHCGMLPEAMLEPMARTQVARDVVMADTMRPHADRGVVLIAGNGHVRRDIGVPHWLRQAGLHSQTEGFVESATNDAPGPATYDNSHAIPAQQRPDPCAQFKQKPAANG